MLRLLSDKIVIFEDQPHVELSQIMDSDGVCHFFNEDKAVRISGKWYQFKEEFSP
jgi:hypothetical protein